MSTLQSTRTQTTGSRTAAPAPPAPPDPAGGPARGLRARVARVAAAHPAATLSVVGIGVSVPLLMGLLLAGRDVMPGKLAQLVLLTGLAALVTAAAGGRRAVRGLFARLTIWRFAPAWWLLVLGAMPAATLAVAAGTGTLQAPASGWAGEAARYALVLVFIGTTASLWEETAWAGVVQTRLAAAHGLVRGALLTAVPFALIHVPLAFETDGWAGTTRSEALVAWALVFGAAPLLRYVIGVVLVGTGGSVLAAAALHASFNASGALTAIPAGWQYAPALAVVALVVAALRWRTGHRG